MLSEEGSSLFTKSSIFFTKLTARTEKTMHVVMYLHVNDNYDDDNMPVLNEFKRKTRLSDNKPSRYVNSRKRNNIVYFRLKSRSCQKIILFKCELYCARACLCVKLQTSYIIRFNALLDNFKLLRDRRSFYLLSRVTLIFLPAIHKNGLGAWIKRLRLPQSGRPCAVLKGFVFSYCGTELYRR